MKNRPNYPILNWFALAASKQSEIKIGLIAVNETDNKSVQGIIKRTPSFFFSFFFVFYFFLYFELALRNFRKVSIIVGPNQGPLQMREITVLYRIAEVRGRAVEYSFDIS